MLTALGLLACGDPALSTAYGDLQISAADAGYAEAASLTVEGVLGGVVARRTFALRNLGQAPLGLEGWSLASGDAVLEGTAPDATHPFALDFPAGRSLAPGESVEVAVAVLAERTVASKLRISASGTRPGEESVSLSLRADVLPSPCELPSAIDFGRVILGQEELRTLSLENPTTSEVRAVLEAPTPAAGDGRAFFYPDGSGVVVLAAQSSRQVLLGFSPSRERVYEASIAVQASPECPTATIELRGEGRARLIDWKPAVVDCGLVWPGTATVQTVRFTSLAQRTVTLSGQRIALGASAVDGDFRLPAPSWAPPLLLAPGQSATREIACSPTTLGARTATLDLVSDLDGQETLSVPLAMTPGGPRISLSPGRMDFGAVAFIPGASYSETRTLAVSNVGQAATQDASAAALRLGTLQQDGSYGEPRYQVFPEPGTAAEEIELVVPDAAAILPPPFNNSLSVPVRLQPRSPGPKRALVVLHSNDPQQPAVSFAVAATAREVPDCRYRVDPGYLDFGVVQASAPKTLGFTFENLGQAPDEVCLLSVDTLTGGVPAYSLPRTFEAREVGPGQKVAIPVALAPQAIGDQWYSDLPGRVSLRVSSATAPAPEVELHGGTGPACLAVQPAEVDFGALAPGEQSPARDLRLLQLCVGPVVLRRVWLESGSPDFSATTLLDIPAAGWPLRQDTYLSVPGFEVPTTPGTVPAAVRYTPQSAGEHLGAAVFEVDHKNGTMRFVVPLRGRAQEQRRTEVVSRQTGGDAVDILFFAPGEDELDLPRGKVAQGVPGFIKHLLASGNDFQIGVQRERCYAPWAGTGKCFEHPSDSWEFYGELPCGPGNPSRVLRPSDPDVVTQLQRKIDLPDDELCGCGSPLIRSWKSLIPPASTGPNEDFPRSDARLVYVPIVWIIEGYRLPLIESVPGYSPPDYFPGEDIGAVAKAMSAVGQRDPSRFSFFGLIPDLAGNGCCALCYQNTPWLSIPLHIFSATTVDGFVGELCPQDDSEWPYMLERLGEIASGLKTHFFLPTLPDLDAGPVEVLVDGRATPGTDASGRPTWDYDARRNAVHFGLSRAPRPGQQVVVRYFSQAPSTGSP